MTATTGGDDAKLARFRQLLEAKRLQMTTPSSDPGTLRANDATTTTTTTPSSDPGERRRGPSDKCARMWLLSDNNYDVVDDVRPAVSSKVADDDAANEEMRSVENRNPNKVNGNGGSGNLAAMKRIMRRKQTAAQDARVEDPGTPTVASDDYDDGGRGRNGDIISSSSSGDDWAMLGNHLEEGTTMDGEEMSMCSSPTFAMASSEFHPAISPIEWKRRRSGSSSSGVDHGDGGGTVVEDGASSGMSGLLSFLGDSPAFDRTAAPSDEEGGGGDEVERNLRRSAEKVERLEEHLLRCAGAAAGTTPSPVRPATAAAEGRTRGAVTFAIGDGWATPRGGGGGGAPPSSSRRRYPKSPYQFDDDGGGVTPDHASMVAQANPLNESVIVSDDEASGSDLEGEPSPLKGIGSDVGVGGAEEDESDRYDAPGSTVEVEGWEEGHRGGRGKQTTPSRAALIERNQTLVNEVRFADQTCVALSERKKFYKNQVGQIMKSLRTANEDISTLRANYESSLQESAQFKVLVESLREQKCQADAQVDAYRTQIADSEKTHRSSLKKMEKTYYSHLKNAEEQINGLNGRLHESLAINAALQSKLDDLHGEWESKLQGDAASRELISSLKDRVASGDSMASNAHASMKALQERVSDLQRVCDQQKSQLQMERSEREMIEQDREDIKAKYDDLHRQKMEWAQTSDALHDVFFNEDGSRNEDFYGALREHTPAKAPHLDDGSDAGGPRTPSHRTPTANLLARTLRSELKRRQTLSEKLEHAERQVGSLKDVICDLKMEYEEAKADNTLLVEELEERDAQIAQLEMTIAAKDDQIARLSEEVDSLSREDGGASSSSYDGRSQSRSQSGSGIESRSRSVRDAASVLEERLDALEETLEFTEEELKETRARLVDTQELLDRTAGDIERSEEELALARDQVSDSAAQVDKLFKDLTEKEVEHANLQRFSHFQTSTIDTINDKLSQSERVNVELRTQLESCFQALVALEKILRTYEDLDGVVGKIMAEQSRKIARLLETMKRFSSQDGGASATPRNLGSREFSEHDFDSPSMFSNLRHEQQIKKELDDANVQLREAHKLLREYRDEFTKKESEHNQETSSLKMELEESNEQLQNTYKLLQQYQDELSKQESWHIQEIETKFKELDVVNTQLQQANKLLEEYQDELRNQESEHSQETSSLKKQYDELEAKLSSVALDLKTCKKENQSLSKIVAAESAVSQQMSVMRSNNTDLMKENESLRVSLQSFEFQLENEKSLLRATQEAADGYRQDVSNAKAAFECITTECDLTKNALSKVEEEAHALRKLVDEKEKDLKECRESQSKAQETFKEQIGSLKLLCTDLETRLSVEESGRLSAEASLDDASAYIANLEGIMKEKDTESLEKESECHQLIIQVKEIQNALADAERERAQADIAIERLENELLEKKSIIFAYEESIISYKGDIRRLDNELQTTIHEKNSRIQMLEQACNSRQTLFSEQLDRTKKERDSSTAELTDMINRLQNELLESNRMYLESGERAKATFIDLNKAHQILEQEIVQKQANLDEATQKYNSSCQELEKAQNQINRMMDSMNSLELDSKRLATRHQDEVEELMEQRNRMHDERAKLEEQILYLQNNTLKIEELKTQQRNEIAQLSAENISLKKKCDKFKDTIKSLNEKNRAWEDSYKAQSDDLMSHGMEITRLNGQLEGFKRVLNSSEGGSDRFMNRQLHLQTPQVGRTHMAYPKTM